MVMQSDIRGIKRNKCVLRPSTVILYIILITGTTAWPLRTDWGLLLTQNGMHERATICSA